MSLSRRDEYLRLSLLTLVNRLGNASPEGWVTGSKLAISARDEDRIGVDSDEHAERLLGDLIDMELVAEKPLQPVAGIGKRDLRHRQFKATTLGWKLLMGQIDPMPGIAGRDE